MLGSHLRPLCKLAITFTVNFEFSAEYGKLIKHLLAASKINKYETLVLAKEIVLK